jgi:hypothetical protein
VLKSRDDGAEFKKMDHHQLLCPNQLETADQADVRSRE